MQHYPGILPKFGEEHVEVFVAFTLGGKAKRRQRDDFLNAALALGNAQKGRRGITLSSRCSGPFFGWDVWSGWELQPLCTCKGCPCCWVLPTSHLFTFLLTSFLNCSQFASSLPTSAHVFSPLPNASQLFQRISPPPTSSQLLSTRLSSSHLLPPLLNSSYVVSPLLNLSHLFPPPTSFHRDALYRETFTTGSSYTEKLLDTEALKQRSLYTEKLSHREAFAQISF